MYSGCIKLSLSDRKQRDITKKGALISSTGFYETNILESLPRIEVFEGGNGKMVALQISPKIECLYGLGRQAKKL